MCSFNVQRQFKAPANDCLLRLNVLILRTVRSISEELGVQQDFGSTPPASHPSINRAKKTFPLPSPPCQPLSYPTRPPAPLIIHPCPTQVIRPATNPCAHSFIHPRTNNTLLRRAAPSTATLWPFKGLRQTRPHQVFRTTALLTLNLPTIAPPNEWGEGRGGGCGFVFLCSRGKLAWSRKVPRISKMRAVCTVPSYGLRCMVLLCIVSQDSFVLLSGTGLLIMIRVSTTACWH